MEKKYIFILSSIIFLQSCYTVLNRKDRVGVSHIKKEVFFEIDNNLTGKWVKIIEWSDYGDQYRILELFDNGYLKYLPNSELIDGEILFGTWGTRNDTLSIKFDHLSTEEKMNYEISETNLKIYRKRMGRGLRAEGTVERLISDSTGEGIWRKE